MKRNYIAIWDKIDSSNHYDCYYYNEEGKFVQDRYLGKGIESLGQTPKSVCHTTNGLLGEGFPVRVFRLGESNNKDTFFSNLEQLLNLELPEGRLIVGEMEVKKFFMIKELLK